MFRTDCKKFYNCLLQTYSGVKNAPDKRKRRTFGRKYMGKKFNIMERCTGSKTSTKKIQAWNGAQYVKKALQRH